MPRHAHATGEPDPASIGRASGVIAVAVWGVWEGVFKKGDWAFVRRCLNHDGFSETFCLFSRTFSSSSVCWM